MYLLENDEQLKLHKTFFNKFNFMLSIDDTGALRFYHAFLNILLVHFSPNFNFSCTDLRRCNGFTRDSLSNYYSSSIVTRASACNNSFCIFASFCKGFFFCFLKTSSKVNFFFIFKNNTLMAVDRMPLSKPLAFLEIRVGR